ncbi:hypothetical protein ACFO3J_03865 [Streptomyces polygonati]|uniref:Uncharacterized protein n=1 Tax=Streptomyces polygonati TaxID=1617087 RepID=A0ABV8HFH9_9ACTN
MASDDRIIEVPGSGALPPDARMELEICLKEFGIDISTEANRLEVSYHVGNGPAIITSSYVREAYQLGRRGHIQRPVPPVKHLLDIASYTAAAVAGVFASNLASPVGSIGFAVSLLVGISTYLVGRNR